MTRLRYLLSTLRDARYRARARLASGWLLTFAGGESNPLGRGERFLTWFPFFLLSQALPGASWAHARRYFFKALSSEPELAREALALIGELFAIERKLKSASPNKRKKLRLEKSSPVLERFFAWCEQHALTALDESPLAKAIGYALNQKAALMRFLEDGRLPIHNNDSERQLRREAIGRKNWLFVGNDDAAEVNTTFVSLIASCQMHGIEPWGYLRDLFCLLPMWPRSRVLELAPAHWRKTLEHKDTQQRLARDVYRQVSIGELVPHER